MHVHGNFVAGSPRGGPVAALVGRHSAQADEPMTDRRRDGNKGCDDNKG
jgi:hypothetical protein